VETFLVLGASRDFYIYIVFQEGLYSLHIQRMYIAVKTGLGYFFLNTKVLAHLLILLKELGDVVSHEIRNTLSSREREPPSGQINFVAAFRDLSNVGYIQGQPNGVRVQSMGVPSF
jgi:hypothetical protein